MTTTMETAMVSAITTTTGITKADHNSECNDDHNGDSNGQCNDDHNGDHNGDGKLKYSFFFISVYECKKL